VSRKITGRVVSAAADKTIVVEQTTRETHPLYGKRFTRSKKFHAHDEKNIAKNGDKVVIEEVKPISRTKTWNLVEVVERGHDVVELKENDIVAEMDAKVEAKKVKNDAEVVAADEKEAE
jgi:small subunit ribosomal protein S17